MVELLVALFIFSVGVLGFFNGILKSYQVVESALFYSMAVNELHSAVEGYSLQSHLPQGELVKKSDTDFTLTWAEHRQHPQLTVHLPS